MAVGFDSIVFAVFPDGDGYLPLPSGPENANEPRTYTATVRMQSGTDVSDLRGLKSIVTVQPAMGFVEGGTVVVEAGVGARSLTYPTAENAELTEDAILVGIVPVGHLTNDDYRVEVTFLLVDVPE